MKIGETQKVGIRAIHYSNAGIKQPNDGIESYSLFYSHQILKKHDPSLPALCGLFYADDTLRQLG